MNVLLDFLNFDRDSFYYLYFVKISEKCTK